MNLFPLTPGEALSIAERHGTPCFVYRGSVAERSFRSLRESLPPRVRLAYAVKANPHPALLARFAGLGASFDCASGGELARLRSLGIPGERILFAGPGKTGAEVALALRMGARIQVDGVEDLEKISSLAVQSPEPVGVNVRVHPAEMPTEGSGIIGGSGPSAFGIDEERLPDFVEAARAFPGVRLRGVQVFTASNELSAERLLDKHRATLAVARKARDLGIEIEEIDLGGGLGIPYAVDEPAFDHAALGAGLARLLADNPWFSGQLTLEPGRFLAGPCGAYLARVTRVKESRGARFAVLEGGINHLARPALVRQPFPSMSPDAEGPEEKVTLAGPLCTSLDRLGEAVLPRLAPGRLVVFGQAGAYGFTESMQLFLSRDAPAEIFVD